MLEGFTGELALMSIETGLEVVMYSVTKEML